MRGRTYRYYQGTPLYPFGYGLNYAKFSVTDLKADRQCATVRVKNESPRAADEVIELYLSDEASPLAPPNPVLCGFRRVHLDPGEEKDISVAIEPQAFTVVDEAGNRQPGSGSWTLYAGFGAPDPRTQALTGVKPASIPLNGGNSR